MADLSGSLLPLFVDDFLLNALKEDMGARGDVTTNILIDTSDVCDVRIVSKADGVIAGIDVAERAFNLFGEGAVIFDSKVNDGNLVAKNQVLAKISGNTRLIFAVERVALNVLGYMSGIATGVAKFVELVSHTQSKISCTRKVIPGMRVFAKYAVSIGGGVNHRFGLYDAILIKDNHIAAAGGINGIVAKLKAMNSAAHMLKVAVEVESEDMVRDILSSDDGIFDHLMLDNMNGYDMSKIVEMVGSKFTVEATGGVNLNNVASIAETGVGYISSGALTHSSSWFDVSLDVC